MSPPPADTARELSWDGLHNVRCLGGLPAVREDGTPTTTVHGRLFRSPRLSLLTPTGWEALHASGVRTVVDLRNRGEGESYDVVDGVVVHRLPIEDQGDAEFMAAFGDHLSSPVYYPEVLRRWPDLVAAVFATLARAPEGAALIHCAAGRDRTGQISAMLLALAGVPHDVVADDHERALRAVNAHLVAHPTDREPGLADDALAAEVAAAREALLAFLADLDVAAYLRSVGLTDADVAALRSRLLDP